MRGPLVLLPSITVRIVLNWAAIHGGGVYRSIFLFFYFWSISDRGSIPRLTLVNPLCWGVPGLGAADAIRSPETTRGHGPPRRRSGSVAARGTRAAA